jgi:predicted transposase/invertase (TIGR01784 family)
MGERGDEVQLPGFLNAVLGRTGDKRIETVEIMEDTSFTAPVIGGKSSVLDVRAVLKDGTRVNIEVQLRNEWNMDRRSLFYWGQEYYSSIKSGQDYLELPNVIAINILDYDYLDTLNFHTVFNLRERSETNLILTSALEIHFINMVKWRKGKTRDIANDPLNRWLAWFDEKSPPELVEEVIGMDMAIMAANEKLRTVSFDEREMHAYNMWVMAQCDETSRINGALERGEQKGEKKKAVEIAKNALTEGVSIELISKTTGLDIKTIQNIQAGL